MMGLKNKEDAAVYRVLPESDGGYSVTTDFGGNGEITRYDCEGNVVSKKSVRTAVKKYKRFRIQVCPIKEFCLIAKYVNPDNAAAVLCSSYPISEEKTERVRNKICLDFEDTTNERHPYVFNMEKAMQIKAFIDSLDEKIRVLYVCCDCGVSRSTAIAAAVSRYCGNSDRDIWKNPFHSPNPLVYKLQCKAFKVFVSDFVINRNIKLNQRALTEERNQSFVKGEGKND